MTRVLACAVGLSPQIVTESLWALAIDRRPNWCPERLAILTTGAGLAGLKPNLLDARNGAVARMARAYDRPDIAALLPTADVRVVTRDGKAVDDITDRDSAVAAEAAAYRLVRDLTQKPLDELHLVVAGGRKSLSVMLGIAMSLCARSQDCMSHVLASSELSGRPEFFYPEPGTSGRSSGLSIHPVPFPRLRNLAGDAVQQEFADQIRAVQRRIDPPSLVLNLAGPHIAVGDRVVRLSPTLAAWAAALFEDALAGGKGLSRVGLARSVIERHRSRIPGAQPVRLVDPLEPELVQEWSSRLNKLVTPFLNRNDGLAFVIRTGRRTESRYMIGIPKELVSIE